MKERMEPRTAVNEANEERETWLHSRRIIPISARLQYQPPTRVHQLVLCYSMLYALPQSCWF